MAEYVVLTDRLTGPVNEKGRATKYLRGDVVSDFSEDVVEKLTGIGAIAKKSSAEAKTAVEQPGTLHPAEVGGADDAAPTPHVAPAASDLVAAANSRQPQPVSRPAKTANKSTWVDYAVRSGQMTQEQAEAVATRDELRDQLN